MNNLSDLSDLHVVQNLFESVGKTLNIDEILKGRDLARRYNIHRNNVPESLQAVCEDITDESLNQNKVAENRLVLTPGPVKAPAISRYQVEQEYEGTVVAVDEKNRVFTARLESLTSNEPDEEGEFSLDELNGDEVFVLPGAVFTWSIGLQTRGPGRQQRRISDLRFRRVPPISKDLIDIAEREAEALSSFFIDTESNIPFTARCNTQSF